jgi:hypothetical protein
VCSQGCCLLCSDCIVLSRALLPIHDSAAQTALGYLLRTIQDACICIVQVGVLFDVTSVSHNGRVVHEWYASLHHTSLYVSPDTPTDVLRTRRWETHIFICFLLCLRQRVSRVLSFKRTVPVLLAAECFLCSLTDVDASHFLCSAQHRTKAALRFSTTYLLQLQ